MLAESTILLPKKHVLFKELGDEIHSRRFPQIQGNVTLSQITVLHSGTSKKAQIKHLQKLSDIYGVIQPNENISCYYQDLGDLDIRWEYHTEFSTYNFIRFNQDEAPFQCSAWSILPTLWCNNIPGELISATHIDIQKQLPSKASIQQMFAGHAVAASFIGEQKAQVLASFRRASDDFERILVINYELSKGQTGRLLRCLLELSSYRTVALLSLPVSKTLLPSIAEMEKNLANITDKLSKVNKQKQQKMLLNELSSLSAKLESLIADNQFRFDATEAYFEIVSNRLNELNEQNVSGATSLNDFLRRRLNPAVKTGLSIKQRMLNMSTRVEKASDLLRTKISLDLEEQNQGLLKALNRRSHIQLRLHQLVESVSMIAISYYVIQMISYMLVLPSSWLEIISKEQVIAISVPIITTIVWYTLHKLKRKWRKEKG